METALSPEITVEPDVRTILAGKELYSAQEINAQADLLIAERKDQIYDVPYSEYRDNARTALMEALTASGHLSRVEIIGQSVEDINQQVLSRLLNGYDQSLPQHELDRRRAEIEEELLIQKTHLDIVAENLPPDLSVSVISDYPEAMTDDQAISLGYRASNKKGMVRTTSLRQNPDGSYSRIIEQVSRSNATWSSTYQFFESYNLVSEAGDPDVQALKLPFVHRAEDFPDGVVDIVQQLDNIAGDDVLYGDRGPATSKHPDYQNLRRQSAEREMDVAPHIDKLASLENHLARTDIDSEERQKLFAQEVDRILTAVCTISPDYATDTYGSKMAEVFYRASDLVASGRTAQAEQLLLDNNQLKEDVTFCGMKISFDDAKAEGLQNSSFSQNLKDSKESWTWKQGVCRVPKCPTRPKPTDIGPCQVCRGCQAKFDKGEDPTK